MTAGLRRRAGALAMLGCLLAACSTDADSAGAPTDTPTTRRPRPAASSTSTSTTSTATSTTSTIAPTSWTTPTTSTEAPPPTAGASTTAPPVEEPPPIDLAPPAPLPPVELTGPLDATAAAAFDAVVSQATVERGDLSAGVAVVRNGEVLHAAGLGMENSWAGTAATPSTRFRIASISKVLTASVLMQLAQEGSVVLDRSFLDQLGRSAADGRMASVTVMQLLSHTSGVGKLQSLFFDEGAAEWHGAAEHVLGSSLSADPGTRYQYSNANFVLLGLLIEHVTGVPYEQAIVERVGIPVGAEGLRLGGTYDAGPGEALYYASPDRNFMEVLGPAGGWMATPTTIAVLADALDGDGLWGEWPVPLALSEAMRTPQPLAAAGATWNYGHGLMLWADGSWGHTGSVEQTHAIVVHRPDDITVSIFVSGEAPSDSQRLAAIADEALRAAAL